MADAFLTITALEKSYGAHKVLKGIDLSVNRHEVVCLIGASGSGKSTLLRCVNALERIDSGVIALDGDPVSGIGVDVNRLRRKVGVVFQSFNLFPHLSVIENVMLAPVKVNGLSRDEARERALKLLDRIGLSERADYMPDQLSGGQQQRVAVARALVTRPALLLADEPTGNLDSKSAAEVFQLFRRFNRKFGCAVLLVTHDPRLSEQCDRTITLVDGRIESDRRA